MRRVRQPLTASPDVRGCPAPGPDRGRQRQLPNLLGGSLEFLPLADASHLWPNCWVKPSSQGEETALKLCIHHGARQTRVQSVRFLKETLISRISPLCFKTPCQQRSEMLSCVHSTRTFCCPQRVQVPPDGLCEGLHRAGGSWPDPGHGLGAF